AGTRRYGAVRCCALPRSAVSGAPAWTSTRSWTCSAPWSPTWASPSRRSSSCAAPTGPSSRRAPSASRAMPLGSRRVTPVCSPPPPPAPRASRSHGLPATRQSPPPRDALTELPNRRRFTEKLEDRRGRGRPGDLIAVLFLDLDGFKDVNDRFGHDAGNDLLVTVAAKLQRCVREGDIVARMGGDEFTI